MTTQERALGHVLDNITTQERPYIALANDDERLIHIGRLLSKVGEQALLLADGDKSVQALNVNFLQFWLGSLAGFVLLWITAHQRTIARGVTAILKERDRQRELFRTGQIAFDVSHPTPDVRRKFRVLFEECGEVAHALDQVENHGMAAGNVRLELTQVAAVCVAWLEALEVQSQSSVIK